MPANDDGEENRDGKTHDVELAQGRNKEDAGGETIWMSEECPPEAAAQFWLSVAAYEQAPRTTRFQELVDGGVKLPAPEATGEAVSR